MAESEEICKAEDFDKCNHMPDGDTRLPVVLNPKERFKLQRQADEHFSQASSTKAHTGNLSRMIKQSALWAAEKLEQNSNEFDSFKEALSREDEGGGDIDHQEIQHLKEELERERNKNNELRKELKQLKNKYGLMESYKDIRMHLWEATKEPKTLDEIVEYLKDKGIEDQKWEHPKDENYSLDLRGIVQFFLDEQVETGIIEVSRKNDKTVYEKS